MIRNGDAGMARAIAVEEKEDEHERDEQDEHERDEHEEEEDDVRAKGW